MSKKVFTLAASLMLAVMMLTGCVKTPHPTPSGAPTGSQTTIGGQSATFEPLPEDITPQEEVQSAAVVTTQPTQGEEREETQIDRMGVYDSKEDVSLYLVTYGVLPDNYITKEEAKRHGWEGGNVEAVMGDGFCIGGDRFGNFEGNLPEDAEYIECDIDTIGYKSRGSRRLVYTEDISVIYYTHDHYDTFEVVYNNGEFMD